MALEVLDLGAKLAAPGKPRDMLVRLRRSHSGLATGIRVITIPMAHDDEQGWILRPNPGASLLEPRARDMPFAMTTEADPGDVPDHTVVEEIARVGQLTSGTISAKIEWRARVSLGAYCILAIELHHAV